jgi:lipoate-protein ligase A
MAIDATMLETGNSLGQAMWRTYGWKEKAITFGYSQRWKDVKAGMPGFDGMMVRRLTGGGIVDHRNDLTYALSIPSGHACYRKPALHLYMELHEQIADIFMNNGISAELEPCNRPCTTDLAAAPGTFCFHAPEPYDVVNPVSRVKLAGAAMKRNRWGILIQGSIDRGAMKKLGEEAFALDFGPALAHWLKLEPVKPIGTLPADTLIGELERFGSSEWNQRR